MGYPHLWKPPYANQICGGFLKWGVPSRHHRFQYEVMVIHDDWMIWGYPRDLQCAPPSYKLVSKPQ